MFNFKAFFVIMLIQMLLILTKSVNRCFEKNPKYDMTPLLRGTDAVFSSLIHAFSWFVFSNPKPKALVIWYISYSCSSAQGIKFLFFQQTDPSVLILL